jgi:hypothetical protein
MNGKFESHSNRHDESNVKLGYDHPCAAVRPNCSFRNRVLEGAAHVRREIGQEGVDLTKVKPAGDVLRGVKDRGQIGRQRVEHLVQVIGAVLKVDGIGIDRDWPRGAPARTATNSACASRIRFVDGSALAPIIRAPIALVTCSAWGQGIPPWLGLGSVPSSLLGASLHRVTKSPITLARKRDRIVAVSDFSGLVISARALASAAAIVPIDSLAGARGRQGGNGPRGSRQTLKIRRHQLRSARGAGGRSCSFRPALIFWMPSMSYRHFLLILSSAARSLVQALSILWSSRRASLVRSEMRNPQPRQATCE